MGGGGSGSGIQHIESTTVRGSKLQVISDNSAGHHSRDLHLHPPRSASKQHCMHEAGHQGFELVLRVVPSYPATHNIARRGGGRGASRLYYAAIVNILLNSPDDESIL